MQYRFKPLAIALAAMVLMAEPCPAATFPARCVRVTADPAVGAVTAPLVVEEWQAVDGGAGNLLSRVNHRKLVIAPGQQVSVSWPISNRYVRLPPEGSYLWRSPCAGGLARFGLFSAAPDALSVSAGGRDASSESGAPELAAPYPLPYDTSRPMGSRAADGSALDVQLSRYVAASGATVRVEWTPVSASLSEAFVPLPSGGDLPTNVTIAVTADLDGNGTYTPGEPFGACHMQLADYAAPEVCLTRTHPAVPRIDLAAAVQNNTYAAQQSLCDRRLAGFGVVELPTLSQDDMPPPSATVRIRFMLNAINGRGAYQPNIQTGTHYAYLLGYDRYIDLSTRPIIDETLLFDAGMNEPGWNQLETEGLNLGLAVEWITYVTWRIVLGNGSIASSVTNNNLATGFVNYYETLRSSAALATPTNTVFVNEFPRLTWQHHPNTSYSVPYPVWHLAVHSAETGGSIVYEQDFSSPCLDADGQYAATLPILPGALGSGGVEIAATNYWWSASPLDAKFTSPFTATRRKFRLE